MVSLTTPTSQTITSSAPCKTFWMEKPSIRKSKRVSLSKIPSSPNQPHFYKEGIDKLPGRWEKVVRSSDEYIIN